MSTLMKGEKTIAGLVGETTNTITLSDMSVNSGTILSGSKIIIKNGVAYCDIIVDEPSVTTNTILTINDFNAENMSFMIPTYTGWTYQAQVLTAMNANGNTIRIDGHDSLGRYRRISVAIPCR